MAALFPVHLHDVADDSVSGSPMSDEAALRHLDGRADFLQGHRQVELLLFGQFPVALVAPAFAVLLVLVLSPGFFRFAEEIALHLPGDPYFPAFVVDTGIGFG